jgi:hypothetical protein
MTENTGRKQDTRFKPGKSGNPAGKPKGSRNATTVAMQAMLDGESGAITRKAIELAKGGDMAALRLCLDRILPPRKDRPVTFVLPAINSTNDAAAAMSAILAKSQRRVPTQRSETHHHSQSPRPSYRAASTRALCRLEHSPT